jgi:hypothetical protein
MRELRADSRGSRPPRPVFNPVYAFGSIIVVLALIIAGDKFYNWHHNRAPFGPDAVDAHVTGLQVLTPTNGAGSNVRAALRALGDPAGEDDIAIPTARHLRWKYVVGRLDITALPAPSGSQYWLVVIDDRTHKLVSLNGSPAAGDTAPGSGAAWEGSLANFALKYSWLAPIEEVQTADGLQDPGMTIGVPASSVTALQFSGVDRDDFLSTPLSTSALTVALLFQGPDGQTWWAKRLT